MAFRMLRAFDDRGSLLWLRRQGGEAAERARRELVQNELAGRIGTERNFGACGVPGYRPAALPLGVCKRSCGIWTGAGVSLLALGCAGAPAHRPAATVATQPTAVSSAPVAASGASSAGPSDGPRASAPEGVMVVQTNCQPGAPEQCNGIDDNCNGQIDEGCGYQSGQIQVTAAWNSGSDIDLHVTDPGGEEIYYGHRTSASGGVLDHDANSACNSSPPTVENVYWSTPNPLRGQYNAVVRAYARLGADPGDGVHCRGRARDRHVPVHSVESGRSVQHSLRGELRARD